MAVVALAVLPGTASATFAPVNNPPGGAPVVGLAASGPAWLAVTESGALTPWLTEDGGASWQPLDVGGQADWMDVSVGPDAAFYVSARVNGAGELLRFPASGGPGQPVSYGLTPSSSASELTAPSWDAQGHMWVLLADVVENGFQESTTLEVARVENGTAVDLATTPDPQGLAIPTLSARAATVIATDGISSYARHGSRLVKLGDDVGVPQLQVGGLTFFDYALSADGGNSLVPQSLYSAGPIAAVHGDPTLAVQNGLILRRYSGSLMVPTALYASPGTTNVWASRGGLVAIAVNQDSSRQIIFSPGSAPALPPALGAPAAASRRMVRRANQIRQASGLPPLLDYDLVARAADNHSRYETLNPRQTAGLSAHFERRGSPGFTGTDPNARCHAVGANCASEILYAQKSATSAVNGWSPTPFHGGILLNPLNWAAGGAVHGRGPAVMDFAPSAGLVTAPAPFPSGRYLGDLGFLGEVPDPRTLCGTAGNHIAPPYGPTLFLNPPNGATVSSIVVTAPGSSRPLHGCRLTDSGEFVIGHPLRRHARYRVTANWRLGSVAETTRWSFATG